MNRKNNCLFSNKVIRNGTKKKLNNNKKSETNSIRLFFVNKSVYW